MEFEALEWQSVDLLPLYFCLFGGTAGIGSSGHRREKDSESEYEHKRGPIDSNHRVETARIYSA